MFKIEDVYVEDKRLGDFFKAIAGLVRGQPRPVHIINVEQTKGGKLKAKANGSGNLVDLFTDHLVKSKVKQFRPKEVKDWLAKQGMSKLSYSYVLNNLRKSGLLKRSGKSSAVVYTVVHKA